MRYAVIALLVLTGCNGTPLGLNFERSSLRAAGDWSSTISLEYEKAEFVPKQQADIQKYAQQLLDFIETGEVVKLPVDELEKVLKSKVPAEFALIVDAIMGYIVGIDVDISGAIGEKNVKRIKAYLLGVIKGAKAYDLKDRDPA